jgi:pimeloyl-ACP methyl ester carboxylesterase
MKRTVHDVQEAADWLKQIGGYDRIVVCGYCAGAYQALHLARRAADIDALLLIELLRYYAWEPLQNAEPPWRARLLRYWARLHPMWLLDRGRIGRWLDALTRSGVRTLVVYRQDEQMLDRFESEVAKHRASLDGSDNFELARLSSSNHILSPLFAQEELSSVLMDFLHGFRTGSPPPG